jgi:hypothetical protein
MLCTIFESFPYVEQIKWRADTETAIEMQLIEDSKQADN